MQRQRSKDLMKADKEWPGSYKALRRIVERHGKNDGLGDGDFWLLDDDWGGFEHVVYVFNPETLTRKLAVEIQEMLARRFPDWSVVLRLSSEEMDQWPPQMVTIFSDQIVEEWDRDFLRSKLGDKFRWDEALNSSG